MTEPVVATTPTTPTTPISPSAATNVTGAKKFEGDGLPFRAKLIGMEDLTVDRDEKICLDSMFKLKAVVRARGEHKQRVQLNLTMNAVKICDENTKAQIASHEIERISFVVIDPRDMRAFGYVYNTSDDRHQFWAIKTERAAAATVLALKELFELAFEQYTNAEKGQGDATKVAAPVSISGGTTAAPTLPQIVTPAVSNVASLLDDAPWGDVPTPPVASAAVAAAPTIDPGMQLWDAEAPASEPQPAAKAENPLFDVFSGHSFAAPAAQPAAAPSPLAGLSFNTFNNPAPVPQPVAGPPNPYANFYGQPTPVMPSYPTPTFAQPPPPRPAAPMSPPLLSQPLQPNSFNSVPVAAVASPTASNSFADLNILGGPPFSAVSKTTKESFFPAAAPKTMQQLQMEKQP